MLYGEEVISFHGGKISEVFSSPLLSLWLLLRVRLGTSESESARRNRRHGVCFCSSSLRDNGLGFFSSPHVFADVLKTSFLIETTVSKQERGGFFFFFFL